jgi:hypothetical protein
MNLVDEFSEFLVLWEKIAEFGQPGSTGKIGILEDFQDFLIFWEHYRSFMEFLKH